MSGLFKSTKERVKEEIGYHLAELKRGNLDDTNEYGMTLLIPLMVYSKERVKTSGTSLIEQRKSVIHFRKQKHCI